MRSTTAWCSEADLAARVYLQAKHGLPLPKMTAEHISSLLLPFGDASLTDSQLQRFSIYLDILLRWNAKMNLTAIREPSAIVGRHFGESLFAASALGDSYSGLFDVGSGAGFPGLPLAIVRPTVTITLIEAQGRKATFLREVIRALQLQNVTVRQARAESISEVAEVVAMRAVEGFGSILGAASRLVAPGGRLCLLIGGGQLEEAQNLAGFSWVSHPIPEALTSVLAIGTRTRATGEGL